MTQHVKPLTFLSSLLWFVIPSAITTAIIYLGLPAIVNAGGHPLVAFLTLAAPLVLLFIASLAAYRLEERGWSWTEFASRMRLQRMGKADWGWAIAATAVNIAGYLGLGFTAEWLEKTLWGPPKELDKIFTGDPNVFAGVALRGAWWFAGLYAVILFFNIFGEELWWRGIIQPRQEAGIGRFAWVAQAVLWTLFHIFWAPDLLRILPGALALSWAVQHRRNTWIGIVVHTGLNGLGLVNIIAGIVG